MLINSLLAIVKWALIGLLLISILVVMVLCGVVGV